MFYCHVRLSSWSQASPLSLPLQSKDKPKPRLRPHVLLYYSFPSKSAAKKPSSATAVTSSLRPKSENHRTVFFLHRGLPFHGQRRLRGDNRLIGSLIREFWRHDGIENRVSFALKGRSDGVIIVRSVTLDAGTRDGEEGIFLCGSGGCGPRVCVSGCGIIGRMVRRERRRRREKQLLVLKPSINHDRHDFWILMITQLLSDGR